MDTLESSRAQASTQASTHASTQAHIQARAQVSTRIESIRAALQRHGLAALIVPSSDPHLSEYLPERWQGRQWASGFTGSAGTLVVTSDFAGVWIDSRYWVQGEAELAGTGVQMMKVGGALSSAYVDWLTQHIRAGQAVAVDGAVMGLAGARTIESALQSVGATLRTDLDLLDDVWPDRPALPAAAIYAHERAPVSRVNKLAQVRAAMAQAGTEWHFIATLDDIAWLTNLRGADVTYNPVFLAHLLIGQRDATVFVGGGKVSAALEAQLKADGFVLAPYEDAAKHVARLNRTSLLLDPKRITWGFRQQVQASVRVVEAINPSTLAKSRKTPEEVEQIRHTMAHDGAALAEFFAWFEGTLGGTLGGVIEGAIAGSTEGTTSSKGERITELTVDERLTACRASRPGFVCPSFSTIAGFNANGAMPHYRATPEAHAVIEGDGMLLIDSGGQYETGTTDITRVIPIGNPSAEQRRDYTLVLKGMIALSMAKFPRGTRSPMLDTIARAPIWAAGVDFGHGTGHGVGYFLNVHEGPHGITPHLPPEPHTAMEPGMITSNEPGIYRPGKWGVRIENLVLNVPAEKTDFGEFLQFETLTLCPIDTRLIDRSLLRADEITWLNNYHAEVKRRVGPLVSGATAAWLAARTAAI